MTETQFPAGKQTLTWSFNTLRGSTSFCAWELVRVSACQIVRSVCDQETVGIGVAGGYNCQSHVPGSV